MTRKKRTTAVAPIPKKQPIAEAEPWSKITCVLLVRHVGYLDIMSVLIRMRHQKAVARTEIIRALVEFMGRSGIDFSQFAAVPDMVAHLVKHFRRVAQPGRLPLLLESSLFHPLARQQKAEGVGPER